MLSIPEDDDATLDLPTNVALARGNAPPVLQPRRASSSSNVPVLSSKKLSVYREFDRDDEEFDESRDKENEKFGNRRPDDRSFRTSRRRRYDDVVVVVVVIIVFLLQFFIPPSLQPTNEPLVHYHDPHRAPAATYGDWFDGDDAELEKMVDEFQNEPQQQHRNNVGDRVRESVAELCGALDELIEEEDAISNGRGIRDSGPSLREQLVDSWQGKSYYERLQNVVDADAVCYIHPSDLMPPDVT